MKHYFKLDGDIIVDAIQHPHEGYVEVELPDVILPVGINGGWYRWNGTNYVLDEELKRQSDENMKESIVQQYADIFEEERQKACSELLIKLINAGLITAEQAEMAMAEGGVEEFKEEEFDD